MTSLKFLTFLVSGLLASSSALAAWQTPSMPTQTLAAQQVTPPVGISATINETYFKIS